MDKFIFTSKALESQWEIKENACCADCDKKSRGYRLAKTTNYDRLSVKNPEFRCEDCSQKKTKSLRKKGIKV